MATEEVKTAWYEFYDQNGGLISRGNRFLETTAIENEIDTVPTMSLTIPLVEMPTEENWNTIQIKVYFGKKYIFWGIIDSFSIDYARFSVTLDLSHIIAEHRNYPMPVNLIVKTMPLKNLYNHMDFSVDGWVYEFSDKATNTRIEYTFSSESKLAALNECLEQTEDIHWRVKMNEEKVLQISEFGTVKDVVISQARSFPDECYDKEDINRYPVMLTEPILEMDFTNHVNRIVVLCGDIDKDVEHMTLRYIYNHPELQNPSFPVGMYANNINQQPEPEYADEDLGNNNSGTKPKADTPKTRTGITE